MATSTKGDAVRLRGPPRKMIAVVSIGVGGAGVVTVTIDLPKESVIVRATITPLGRERSEIRLELPAQTPPGTYTGTASFEGKQWPVYLDVEPVERLRIHPKQTKLAAAAGERAEFGVTVVNVGNVPVTIPRASSFDLEDDDGQDRALGRTLRAELGEGETRTDRFFEELRDTYGGDARVAVTAGAGAVEPGECADVSAYLEVPVLVQPGRTYTGGWDIGDAAHFIVLEAVNGGTAVRRRARRKE